MVIAASFVGEEEDDLYVWIRRFDSEEDRERLNAMNCLAMALEEEHDYSAALPLYEQVLAIRRRTLGDLHANTLTCIYSVAQCHNRMDNPSMALPLAEECLRGRRQTSSAA